MKGQIDCERVISFDLHDLLMLFDFALFILQKC